MRPFLKWAGNKYNLLKTIIPHLPSSSRLIEPFLGSGAVFLNTDYPEYLLGEQNKDLVDLFQLVQKEGFHFIDYCADFFQPEYNQKTKFYELRDEFNHTEDKSRRAALFLYLNKFGYNGLCRYNQSGIFNVPFGSHKRPYFPKKELLHFHQKSQQAQFFHQDFRTTFALAKPGDVIYCDPPYIPLSKSSNFTEYTNATFNEKDQIDLALMAEAKMAQGSTVLISNHNTDFSRDIYHAANLITFSVRRHISCLPERKFAEELIAIYSPSPHNRFNVTYNVDVK